MSSSLRQNLGNNVQIFTIMFCWHHVQRGWSCVCEKEITASSRNESNRIRLDKGTIQVNIAWTPSSSRRQRVTNKSTIARRITAANHNDYSGRVVSRGQFGFRLELRHSAHPGLWATRVDWYQQPLPSLPMAHPWQRKMISKHLRSLLGK